MTPEQKEYLAYIEQLRKEAVSSVVEDRSSALTAKNRARMKKVSEDLAAGRNPYYDPNNESDTNKGGDVPEHIKAKDKVVVAVIGRMPLPEILRRTHGGKVEFGPGSKIAEELGFDLKEPTQVPPGHTLCDFCHSVVPTETITKGTLKPRKIMSLDGPHEDPVTGRKDFEWKMLHTVDKVAACPDCVLNIRPITDKYGAIVSQGVQFKPSEG